MAEIVKIKKDGIIQYPITKPEAVIDENGKTVLDLIAEASNGEGAIYVTDFSTNDLYQLVHAGAAPIPANITALQDALRNKKVVLVPALKDDGAFGYNYLSGYYEDLVYFSVTSETGDVYCVEVNQSAEFIDRNNITYVSPKESQEAIKDLRQKDVQTDNKLTELSAEMSDIVGGEPIVYEEEKVQTLRYMKIETPFSKGQHLEITLTENAATMSQGINIYRVVSASAMYIIGHFDSVGQTINVVLEDDAPGGLQFENQDANTTYGVKVVVKDVKVGKLNVIAEKVDKIEESVFVNKTFSIDATKKVAYTLSLGVEPISVSNSNYSSFVVKVQKGDIVIPTAKTGSSFNAYGKIKNGIVIEVGAKGIELNSPIECDGSFDTIIINNYLGYVLEPTCVLHTKVGVGALLEDAETQELKILCFGNSFTQDSMSYVPYILKNIAPNLKITIGIAYIGGCPLVQHCANLREETLELDGKTYSPTKYILFLHDANANVWVEKGGYSASDCLKLYDWDIVTFQQAGGQAPHSWDTYYSPYIYKIHKAVFDKMTHPVKLGWLSIHGAYANDVGGIKTMWEQTTENTEKVQNLTGNEVIFPFGTAVQNLSTIASLADIGEGAGMTADGGHLHEGLPCLAAAYANALTILREAGLEWKSIIGEGTRPTKEWCSKIGVPGTNYGEITNDVVGITEDNCYLAQVAAIQAVKNPYEISDLANFVE